MNRRNHFKLVQGCDPWTCTNCSCEGCKNNKMDKCNLGQITVPDPELPIGPTGEEALEHEPWQPPPSPTEDRGPTNDTGIEDPLTDVETPIEEAGIISEKAGKVITTVQAVGLVALMTGASSLIIAQMNK